jgi:hypothetical protein
LITKFTLWIALSREFLFHTYQIGNISIHKSLYTILEPKKTKKPSDFREINPQSTLPSWVILRTNPKLFSKSTQNPTFPVQVNLQRKP